MVSRTAPIATSSGVDQPDQAGRRLVPGQSSHQKAIIATTGSAKVTSGAEHEQRALRAAGAEREQQRHRHDQQQPGQPRPAGGRPLRGTPRAQCRTARAIGQRRRAAARGSDGAHDVRRVHDELGGERQLADPAAGGVEDGVGDRRGRADLADLADALDAERVDDVVVDLDELDRRPPARRR